MRVHTNPPSAAQNAVPVPSDSAREPGAPTGTRLRLMRAWARVGALFNTTPAAAPIDLEQLIADTATVAPADERLFVMAASWLALHHNLVDARRLGRRLDTLDDVSSAVAGAMLTMAAQGTSGPTALTAAASHCRPLPRRIPLFPIMERYQGLLALVRAETLPIFAQWGFWHNDAILKPDAIRPVRWILEHCPELRIRAILGTGLDTEVVGLVAESPRTVAELARLTGASYASVHAAVARLGGRGLVERRDGKRWGISPVAAQFLQSTSEPPPLRRAVARR